MESNEKTVNLILVQKQGNYLLTPFDVLKYMRYFGDIIRSIYGNIREIFKVL